LLPTVALLYFEKRLGNEVRLSVIQSSILLGMGLQRKSVEEVEVRDRLIFLSHSLIRSRSQAELQLPVSQALALFVKLIRKISGKLQDIQKAAISSTIRAPAPAQVSHDPGTTVSLVADAERGLKTMEAELDAAGDEATAALREKQRAMIDALDLSR
jgi:N-acetyltransferase 10